MNDLPIIKFLSFFIPDKNKKDKDLYIKSLLLSGAHFLSLLFAAGFMLLHYTLDYQWALKALSIIFILIFADIFIFRIFGNTLFSGNFIIFAGFVGFSMFILTSGGIHSPTISWLTAVSLTGFLFADRKSGFFWTTITTLSLAALYYIDLKGIKMDVLLPEASVPHHFFSSYLGATLYIVLTVVVYDFLYSKKAKELNLLLNENAEKTQQLMLQQEELNRLSIVASHTDNAVIIMDKDGKFEWVNSAFTKLYGYTLDDLIKERSDNIKNAMNYVDIDKVIETIKTEKKSETIKTREHDKNGTVIYTQTTITPIVEENEVSRLIAINTDITEIIEKEEELRQRNEEILQQQEEILAQRDFLADSETRIQKIIESIPDAVMIIDEKGIVTHWNKAIEKMTGVPASDMIGKGDYEYALPFYNEKRPILINLVSLSPEYIAANYSFIDYEDGVLKAETYVPNLKGEPHYLIGVATAITNAKGEYNGAIEVIHDITTRKKQSEELEKKSKELEIKNAEIQKQKDELEISEARIKKIIEFLPDATFIVNEIGEVTHWNKAIEQMTGVPASEIIGKGNFEYALPFYNERRPLLVDVVKFDDEYIKENFPHVHINGNIYESDTIVPSLRGEERYLIGTATALYNVNGQFDGAIEIIHDITERKKEKQRLKRLSIVASHTDNAIIIMDKNGDFEWVNSAFTKLYGYSFNDLINKRSRNIRDAMENAEIDIILDKINREKTAQTIKSRERDIKGNTIYTQTTISPILNEEQEIVNLIAINTDITELVTKEEELKQRNEEILQQQEEIMAQRDHLADSEAHIRKIIESIPDAIMIIDKNGIVTHWNHAIEVMTGVEAKDMIGKGDYEYALPFYNQKRPILIDLVVESSAYIRENYSFIQQEDGVLRAETYVPNLRGEARYLIGVAAVITDAKGNYDGAIEVIHDISSLKRAKEAVEKHQKEITDSIQYASRIQTAVLPSNKLMKETLNNYFVFYKPRNIVSGDFYWLKKIGQKTVIAVADCTGHGVPGAFVSMLGMSFLNEIVHTERDMQANMILERLRDMIKTSLNQKGDDDVEQKDGMDIALSIIDTQSLKLEYAGAYNPLYIYREKVPEETEFIEIKGTRQPIAIYHKEKPFESREIQLQKNDMLYMFSDGYADQFGGDNKEKFKYKRFKDLLSRIYTKPLNEQKEIIERTFNDWKGDNVQIDDIMLIGIKM